VRLPVVVMAAGLVLSGCGNGGAADGHDHGAAAKTAFSADEADTEVEVEMKDYAFVGVPASVQGPKVFFAAETTQGEHELVVLREGEEVAAVHPPPRGKGDLAVELQPGDYVLVCRITEGAKSHEELGMRQPLSVR
jgi:hypothetical protein